MAGGTLCLENGTYGLIEVKLGGEALIEKGVASLLALSDRIDTTKMRKPSFKMVVVANGEFAYRRKDGVVICPLSALRP